MEKRKILSKAIAIFMAVAVALCSAPPALTAYAQDQDPVTVYFGSYYQDPITDESQIQIIRDEVDFTDNVGELSGTTIVSKDGNYFKKTPIAWRVIENNGGSYTLLSEKVLAFRDFGSALASDNGFWDNSTLRGWLNSDFYSTAFTDEEQDAIFATDLEFHKQTYDDWRLHDDGSGALTTDKVYLLHSNELTEDVGLGDEASRIAYASAYADSNEGAARWWLRGDSRWNYGNLQNTFVQSDGSLGSWYTTYSYGVRPVIQVKSDAPGLTDIQPEDVPVKSEKKTLSKRFTLGKDNNSFWHGHYSDKRSGFYGVSNLTTSAAYLKAMKTASDERFGKAKVALASLGKHVGWCFGLTSTVALVHEGYLKPADISDNGESTYFALAPPCDNRKLRDTINYYQIEQTYVGNKFASCRIPDNIRNGVTYITQDTYKYQSFLQDLVSAASLDRDLLFSFANTNGGHTVLITDCYYNEKTGIHTLVVYDVNSEIPWNQTYKEGAFGKIQVDLQEGTMEYINFEGNVELDQSSAENDTVISFLDVKKLAAYTNEGIEVAKTHSIIKVPFSKPVKITAGGKTIYDNTSGKIKSDVKVYSMIPSFYDIYESDGYMVRDADMQIEIDPVDELTVENPNSEDVEIYVADSERAAIVSGAFYMADMSLEKGVSFKGSSTDFVAGMTSDDSVFTLSGSDAYDLKIEKTKDGFSSKAEESITDAKTVFYDGETVQEKDKIANSGTLVVDKTGGVKTEEITPTEEVTPTEEDPGTSEDVKPEPVDEDKGTGVVGSVRLSKRKFVYNGKKQKPVLIIKDTNGKTVPSSQYTVSGNLADKGIGIYEITVIFEDKYSNNEPETLTYKIVPAKSKIIKKKAGKKKVTLKAKKVKGQYVRYQFAVRKAGTKKWKYYKSTKNTKTIKKLKSKKKYQVKVRAYAASRGAMNDYWEKPVYGSWSKVTTVKIK